MTFIASDLSRDVLDRARAGRYSQMEINRGLPAPLLVKYFKKCGLDWEISPDIRKMVEFKEVNLLEAWPPMPLLDLVFIRNVLIYFSNETKMKILGRIRGMMHPAGYLFLGGSETTLNLDDKLEYVPVQKAGCYRNRARPAAAA
jgi:chemotaxis protein methyltransferase CheR